MQTALFPRHHLNSSVMVSQLLQWVSQPSECLVGLVFTTKEQPAAPRGWNHVQLCTVHCCPSGDAIPSGRVVCLWFYSCFHSVHVFVDTAMSHSQLGPL